MKKKLFVLLLSVVVGLSIVSPVNAGGDQVRGEEGVGPVNQHQVVPPPVPFP